MVSQALVQAKTAFGLGRAAQALGAWCQWYRPSGPNNPLARPYGQIIAYFRAPAGAFVNPLPYGKAVYHGTFDPTLVQIGDYMVEPEMGTFFVAALNPVSYSLCVLCNHTMTFSRPGSMSSSDTGAPMTSEGQPDTDAAHDYYGGDIASAETSLMTGWPAAVLTKSRGSLGETKLPGDVRLASFEILMPAVPGVILQPDDQGTDENGLRYTVSSPELTSYGWRLLTELAFP
jgi:hypothetical protein